MIQAEGIVRLGADAATATAVTGVVSVVLRDKSKIIRPEPTWDDATPDPSLGENENEVEITFKNTLAANSFNLAVMTARAAGTSTQYLGVALTDAAIGAGNPLYSTTIALTGAEVGGKAGQENTQRWVYPCGAIASTETDPQA